MFKERKSVLDDVSIPLEARRAVVLVYQRGVYRGRSRGDLQVGSVRCTLHQGAEAMFTGVADGAGSSVKNRIFTDPAGGLPVER